MIHDRTPPGHNDTQPPKATRRLGWLGMGALAVGFALILTPLRGADLHDFAFKVVVVKGVGLAFLILGAYLFSRSAKR